MGQQGDTAGKTNTLRRWGCRQPGHRRLRETESVTDEFKHMRIVVQNRQKRVGRLDGAIARMTWWTAAGCFCRSSASASMTSEKRT